MPRRDRLELPRRSPRAAGLSTGPFRTNFQPRPSLHPVTYSSKPTTSGPPKLDLILNLDYGVYAIGKDQVRLRTYNGSLVGPVLRVKAGDVLYITLVNYLPLNPEPPTGHDVQRTIMTGTPPISISTDFTWRRKDLRTSPNAKAIMSC